MGKYVTVDLIRMQPKLTIWSLDNMSLTNALFLLLHLWKMVPLKGSQMDTHAQGRKPLCLVHSVCAALLGIGLWDLQS